MKNEALPPFPLAVSSIRAVAIVFALGAVACSGGTHGAAGPSSIPSPPVVAAAITPGTGSVYGGSLVSVTTTLDRMLTVSVDGKIVTAVHRTDGFTFLSPPHATGTVTVTLTDPRTAGATTIGTYTYVEPESFDLNGTWSGATTDGSDILLDVVVTTNRLSSVHCFGPTGGQSIVNASDPVAQGRIDLKQGQNSFSAWAASPVDAAGLIDLPSCPGGHPWRANRKG